MSDILDAINDANEKKFKAIVDHTGSCKIYHYEAGVETELSESVIKALGKSVTVIGEVQPATPQEQPQGENTVPQEEQPKEETQPENKEVSAPPVDKMISNDETITK